MNKKRVTFYPSQIGSLLGTNKHRDPEEEYTLLHERYYDVEVSCIQTVDVPPKYEAFIEKQIEVDDSTRIKSRVERLSCDNEVKKAIQSKIYTERGIQCEKVALDLYEEEHGVSIQRPTHFISRHYIYNNNEFFIGGRIDGFMTENGKNILFEVKTRQNNVYNDIPEYEKIQIECYMRMINAEKCVFIQHFQKENHVTIYYRDDQVWKTILEKCTDVSKKIYNDSI